MHFKIELENLQDKGPARTDAELKKISDQYCDWVQSDFAGFRNVLDTSAIEYPDLEKMQKLASSLREGIKNFVVLGMGGSTLGAEAVLAALHPHNSELQFYFIDNNDPDFFSDYLKKWQASETLFYAVSKSGSTLETWSQSLVAMDWLRSANLELKNHLVCCSDPVETELRILANRLGVACLDNPLSVGGRYAVLTAVGLFPAIFAGIDARDLLAGANQLVNDWENLPLMENPSFQLASALCANAEKSITISMPYSSRLKAFSLWFCQLWAESLGKEAKGFTPYPATGTTDQHSQIQLYMEGPRDKVIGFTRIGKFSDELNLPIPKEAEDLNSASTLKSHTMAQLLDSEYKATRDALTQNSIPNFTIGLSELNAKNIGSLLYFWQWTTVWAGAIMKIDPFNQPGVELAKKLTKQYLKSE